MLTRLPNLLSVLIIALLAANYFAPFGDLDFAWQVRTGERIVQTGTLQPPDAFSYTIEGKHVPDFEWLYEVVLYLVWSGFGFGGLKFLRIVLIGSTLVLLVLRLRREGVRVHAVTATLLLVTLVLAPAWNLRPLFCTTIGLLLLAGWLHDHCTGRRPLPVWVPVLMLIWGNVHPGVIAGQGLLVMAIVSEWLQIRFSGGSQNRAVLRTSAKRLTIIGMAGLAASLVCPGPIERFLYPFQPELRHPIQRIFAEMRPLYAVVAQPPYTLILVYVVAMVVAITIIVRFRAYRWWEIGLLVSLGGLANLASRSVPDWLLLMLALCVPHMAAVLARAARTSRRRPWTALVLRLDISVKHIAGSRWCRYQRLWPAVTVAVLFIVSAIPPLSRQMPVQYDKGWPTAAVAYIEQNQIRGRFFGPPDYGSLLIWQLPGQAKAYTDTRGFFYPPVFIEDSHLVPQLGPDWLSRLERVLDEYRTDYFLLETRGPRGALWHHLGDRVGAPLYVDEISVLLSAGQVRTGLKKSGEIVRRSP